MAVVVLYIASPGTACGGDQQIPSSRFTLYWENDSFANTDRDYTNGLKLTWSSNLGPGDQAQNRFQRLGNRLSNLMPFGDHPQNRRGVSLTVGQSIYTPTKTRFRKLIVDERPYAGYLYSGIGLSAMAGRRLTVWGVDVGIVGPSAMGEQVQNVTHEIVGVGRANGWDNQLNNELTLEIIYETKWRLWDWESHTGLGFGLISHVGGRMGNVAIWPNMGAEIRFGWRLKKDFGSCPIRAGCDFGSISGLDQEASGSTQPLSIFSFISTDARWVIRDIFLDGNTWRSSHSVEKEPFVTDLMYGLVIYYKKFRASFAYVWRSKQYKLQEQAQLFGAITISFVY